VVYSEPFDEKDKLTLRDDYAEILEQLNGDASRRRLPVWTPINARGLFAEPTILPATDILFDAWALTTIRDRMPGRRRRPYLHGLAEWSRPHQCRLRQEVQYVGAELIERQGDISAAAS